MSTYVTAVDIGSGKIAVAVGENRDGRVHVIHYESAPSAGIRYGEIFNERKVSQILNPMIRRAEQAIGETISSVVVGVSGKFINTEDSQARDKQRDTNRRISIEDVRRMIAEQYGRAAAGDAVLEVAPQSYDVDDQVGLSADDLDGIRSSTLDGYFKVVTGGKALIDALQGAGLFRDDCQIKRINLEMREPRPPKGLAQIRIEDHNYAGEMRTD